MPADQRRRLHNDQCLAPVEPAGEPDQSETGGMGGAPWFDRALLLQGQLLAKKKIFGGKGGGRPQTEPEITNAIYQQQGQRIDELSEMTNQAHEMSYRQGFPLRWVVVPTYYRPWEMQRPERCG
jgi:hypothetical protein